VPAAGRYRAILRTPHVVPLLDAVDWRAGFIAAALAAALGALVAFARRASLQPGLQAA
jgi:hypothetical protein